MGEIADIGSVYKIICTDNGEIYIGSSSNFANRKRGHLYSLRKGTHHSPYLQRAFNKYGEGTFLFEVIESSIILADLIKRETYYIKQLKPSFNAEQPSPTRQGSKQSESCKAKVSAANRGRKHSPAARIKIAKALEGNKYGQGNKNRRKITFKLKNRIEELKKSGLGCRKIAAIFGVNKTTILNVFNGRFDYGRD